MESIETDFYHSEFLRKEKELAGGSRPWIRNLRREAMDRFIKAGFPTSHQEEWRHTNIAPVLKVSFKPAVRGEDRVSSGAISRIPIQGLSAMTMVFVNGHYRPDLSVIKPLLNGLEVRSLRDLLEKGSASLKPFLNCSAKRDDHAFAALNAAFWEDGGWIRIPENTIVETPIHLMFLSTASGAAVISHPRNVISVGDNSQVAIVESYYGLDGGGIYFTNAVTEIVVGENATVEHCKIEWEDAKAFHLETVRMQQSRQSRVTSYSIALGGALVRNEIHSVLDGEGAECALYGLYMVDGRRFVDNHTRIDHMKSHTTSRELYKGALNDKGQAVFNGRVVVHPLASRIDAKQTNKNLLLSDEASVHSKPQLEISNNDVKCTHGSTIGQLDREALFYLRSRGIGEEAARRLLVYAFAGEIVRSMRIPSVRENLDRTLLTGLRGETAV